MQNNYSNLILNLIAEFEYVPRDCLVKLICNNFGNHFNKKSEKYVRGALIQMLKEHYFSANDTAYFVTGYDLRRINSSTSKALWVIAELSDIDEVIPAKSPYELFFVKDNAFYKIANMRSDNFKIILSAMQREKNNDDKTIIIVDNDSTADMLSDSILKSLNCIALCTVDERTGQIESYEL